MKSTTYHTNLIREEAFRLGFDQIGISPSGFLEDDAPRLEQWLNKGMHGQMAYMGNHFDKRLDTRKLVPGSKSVISLSYNYFTEDNQPQEAPKVSKYAYGEDYHQVLKAKLRELLSFISENIGEVAGRCFVDSAPVMERSWAAKSGLGWIGKHSLLLSKSKGSYFFLAELIIDLELDYDGPTTDHCGNCTRCIDACPTDAIIADKVLDASKCISYLTIELRDELPSDFEGKFENWMFGCDICQDVCPWNRFSKPHQEEKFKAHPKLLEMNQSEWTDLSKEVFNEVFRRSAVKRTKYTGLTRNIAFLNRTKQNNVEKVKQPDSDKAQTEE